MPLEYNEDDLRMACAKRLRISADRISHIRILKKSLDARKKTQLQWVLNLCVEPVSGEKRLLHKFSGRSDIFDYREVKWEITHHGKEPLPVSPVIVGAGPAGLFCAYILAMYGYAPVVLERGMPVERRQRDVEAFWETGILQPESNVQFGEGGAGTFSDGKLNTLVHDTRGGNRFVLETFVKFGAPKEILYEQKPHIGTDVLIRVVRGMREAIMSMGGEIRFHAKVDDLIIADGKLQGIQTAGEQIPTTAVVLAIGHSARDTVQMLYDKGVAMSGKDFAVGFRVEHPQEWLNRHQYGMASHPALKAATYKLAANLENGRGVYSFCMCPGGYVVNASSEEGLLAVNGMSYSDRDSGVANSAIIVSVGAREFDKKDPLAAIAYQRSLERRAYQIGEGKIPQQLWKDFSAGRPSVHYGGFVSRTKGQAVFGDLSRIFSEEVNRSFLSGMNLFEQRISGFTMGDAVLSGVESRTSSPVRIERGTSFESNISGIYPCGEGAGYAGGIMSAALDGMKVAQQLIATYAPLT